MSYCVKNMRSNPFLISLLDHLLESIKSTGRNVQPVIFQGAFYYLRLPQVVDNLFLASTDVGLLPVC